MSTITYDNITDGLSVKLGPEFDYSKDYNLEIALKMQKPKLISRIKLGFNLTIHKEEEVSNSKDSGKGLKIFMITFGCLFVIGIK